MWRISRYRETWRIGLLLLLLVAIIGPWTFDKIHVPSQYACGVRLDGDYCGIPLSGFRLFAFVISGLVSMSTRLLTGATADTQLAREFFSVLSTLLLFLPVVTSLVLIVRGEQRRRRWFQVLALCLALCVIAGLSLLDLPGFSAPLRASWGIWFYIFLLICALTIELLTLVQERTLISGES